MDGHVAPERGRHTLKAPIDCVGIGVHSGRRVALTLRPTESGAGISFRRTDLGIEIPARFDHVVDTRLCTTLAAPGRAKARIGTVEHVMAALAGCGVDDAIIEVDGPEVPILDGSAAPFVFLIDCAGILAQSGVSSSIEVLRTVRVHEHDGPDAAWAEIAPVSDHAERAMQMALTIDFPGTAIGRQQGALRLTRASFRAELADARTFTLADEVERLRAAGLAQGGSLANAIVVDGLEVLNPGGLRRPDEFVRHKLLDAVGDLALAGARLRGRFTGYRSGHALNNRLLRALFADPAAWRAVASQHLVQGVTRGTAAMPLPAAACPAVA
jgi:UDP-3-O-[3-hydroxymyristoyl] N-acetylglucosamine deacetylase